MAKYIALLRGINVGGQNKVDMKSLKKAFEELTFTNVSTYINSGNVLFETNLKATVLIVSRIEEKLRDIFGFDIRVIVRTFENIKQLCSNVPSNWADNAKHRTYVMFLWEEFDNKNTLDMFDSVAGVDKLMYVDGAIIWNMDRDSYNESGMKKLASSRLYKHMTIRNINTVRKLNDILCSQKASNTYL